MTITLNANPSDAPCCLKIEAEDGRDMLVQTDWDWPAIASVFGWSIRDVKPKILTACFNRFSFDMPLEAVDDCSHSRACDDDVEHWAKEIERPGEITPELLALELKEYGAWNAEELSDDDANWHRIVWLAAGNLKDDMCEHANTDGTVDCPKCGVKASQFIQEARQWLDDNDGAEAEDPGYFEV
jgi:hypothetical protein